MKHTGEHRRRKAILSIVLIVVLLGTAGFVWLNRGDQISYALRKNSLEQLTFVQDTDGNVGANGISWNGRHYSLYDIGQDNSFALQGKQFGVADGNFSQKVCTANGYEPTVCFVLYADVEMGWCDLYVADDISAIPAELVAAHEAYAKQQAE
jgi:hypothetical protein